MGNYFPFIEIDDLDLLNANRQKMDNLAYITQADIIKLIREI
jgi:hypothetical protein